MLKTVSTHVLKAENFHRACGLVGARVMRVCLVLACEHPPVQPFVSRFKTSCLLATMSGLGNIVRARAELASWPQFEGHFREEEAKVEEGQDSG